MKNSLQGHLRGPWDVERVDASPPHTCLTAQFKSLVSKTTVLGSGLHWPFVPETKMESERDIMTSASFFHLCFENRVAHVALCLSLFQSSVCRLKQY